MLRAVSSIYIESQTFELLAAHRRDVFKVFRTGVHTAHASSAAHDPHAGGSQTVLTSPAAPPPQPAAARACPPPPPPPPPRPPPQRRAWTLAAAALALTASLGGVYFYRKMSDAEKQELVKSQKRPTPDADAGAEGAEEGELYPSSADEFPARVEFLVVGGGTAAFAALRALRAARPDAALLLVGAERAPPYMRPPLSKELWRRPDLAAAARDPLALSFTQLNGKRRSLVYEPLSFYTPLPKLAAGGAGAGLARGWRVSRLELGERRAELSAPGRAPAWVRFDKALLATGSAPRRLAALAGAARAGRSLALHTVRDAARLAAALDEPAVRRVAVVGAGLLATELAAALADRLAGSGRRVTAVYRERAPLDELLPPYLAADAARRLAAAGVTLMPLYDIESSTLKGKEVHMKLKRVEGANAAEGEGRGELVADLVIECVGAEPVVDVAAAAGLEIHPELGGIVVNAELAARSGVWAAGDAACFHDALLGRRRAQHHDHAVLSGRRAAENMAAERPRPYDHQSMFWSDLGPDLGYEAIGLIDSKLKTVGVFATNAVSDVAALRELAAEAGAGGAGGAGEGGASGEGAGGASEGGAGAEGARAYEHGVVFYLRGQRVVGVLLWNLFNRMHIARQVLAKGEFEDLLEVAKLFAPHEDD